MKQTYYPLRYRLDDKDRFLIWFTSNADHSDGVVVDKFGKVPVFINQSDVVCYGADNGFDLAQSESPRLHNLDVIVRWLKAGKSRRARQVDCGEFLCAWNLFADVAKSTGGEFDSVQQQTQKIYEKLLWGNNFPATTPPGKWYLPRWSGQELEMIHRTMRQGLHIFRTAVRLHQVPDRNGR